MPETAPKSKVEAVKAYGGEPVLVPVAEVFRFLQEHGWEQEPYAFIHPWTDRRVMTGHGSLALEIVEAVPDVDTVFVPVGGGGLLGGVGAALKSHDPRIRIVAVEPEGCPSLHASLAAGHPTEVRCETICDGVAVPYMTEEMFPLLRDLVTSVHLVSEECVVATIRSLVTHAKLVAEGAAALSIAAAVATPPEERGKSVCLLTGGSIDSDKLAGILMS
jgi:threonine dehydratase